ncbi:MAG: Helix-turn-helix domain [Pelosinus sp.]|nr:Helix-turn-helix domain [Pelosinus sp.]
MGYNIKEIGDRAYRARAKQRIKQSHVCEVLGIAQSTYSRFENGQADLPVTKIMTLCDVLGISPMWLLYGIKDDSE